MAVEATPDAQKSFVEFAASLGSFKPRIFRTNGVGHGSWPFQERMW